MGDFKSRYLRSGVLINLVDDDSPKSVPPQPITIKDIFGVMVIGFKDWVCRQTGRTRLESSTFVFSFKMATSL